MSTDQKFVKVSATYYYIVPADNEEMIAEAKDAILEDQVQCPRISVESFPDGTWDDVPEFLRGIGEEYNEEE